MTQSSSVAALWSGVYRETVAGSYALLARIPNTQRFQWLSVRELLLRERILMISECPRFRDS